MDLGGVPWERDRSVNLASPSSNAVNDAFDLLFSELICVNIARSGQFQGSKVADALDDYWLTSARQRLSSEYPRRTTVWCTQPSSECFPTQRQSDNRVTAKPRKLSGFARRALLLLPTANRLGRLRSLGDGRGGWPA